MTVILTMGLILLCCSKRFHKCLFKFLDWLDLKFDRRFDVQIASLRGECRMLERASRQVMKNRRLVTEVTVVSTIRNAFWYGMPFLVFAGHADITFVQTMAITSLSIMLAAIIPAPGGIGSTEVLFTTMFSGIVGTGLAGSAALLYRFGTSLFPLFIGAFVVIGRRVRGHKHAYM